MGNFRKFLMALSLILVVQVVSAQDVNYFQGSVSQLKKTAEQSGKSYIVKFHTSWCVNCRKLDAQTFSDWELSNYINENMLAISLDGEKSSDGVNMVNRYNIKVYPTVLLFDANGKLVKRYEGMFSPNYFLSEIMH